MEWRDSGFVLSARRHGESALIAELLTAEHGRHAGLVRGGQSPHRRALLQPGNSVIATWRGRLPEHLGTLECELIAAHAARVLDDADRLLALGSATALLLLTVPEREPQPVLYRSFTDLMQALSSSLPAAPTEERSARRNSLDSENGWAAAYVVWECDLLTGLGFGLDLACCAATGVTDDLAYVSPRSGRAVSRAAGRPYHDKLLPLPGFLWRETVAEPADIAAGLILTEHFLMHHVLAPHGGKLPEARGRLVERMRRAATAGIIAS